MVSFPPSCGTIEIGFFETPSHEPLLVCVCARMSLSLSLSISLYLSLSLSLLSFLGTPASTIAWERPDIQDYCCEKHIIYCFQKMGFFLRQCWICWICSNAFFKKMFLSAEMLNMLNVFRFCRPLLNTPITWGGPNIQHYSWMEHLFQVNVPFCGNVEYVEYVHKPFFSKNCFFLQKCWACWLFLELSDPFRTPQLPEGDPTFNITVLKTFFQNKMFLSAEMLNTLSMFTSLFLRKIVLRKCWIGWMFLELTNPFWTPQVPEGNPTFNITTERNILQKMFLSLQKYWQYWICSKACLQKCVSVWVNVEYVEYVECFWNLLASFQRGL